MASIEELILQNEFQTERLKLSPLTKDDRVFIQQLTNTKGWLKFIGDRGTATMAGTNQYIEKIIQNPDCKFWVVSLKNEETEIGMVTLMKRDYLQNPDIGFAFLPKYNRKGYAFEASKIVFDEMLRQPAVSGICGITNKGNASSIKLLKNLGLTFHSTVKADGDVLEMYSL